MTPPGPPRGTPNLFHPSLPLPALQKDLPTLLEGLLNPPGHLGGTSRLLRPFRRASQPLLAFWKGFPTSPGPPNPSQLSRRPPAYPGPPGGLPTPPIPSQPYGRASRPFPAIWQGFPIPPDPPGHPERPPDLCRPSRRAS